MYRMVAQGELGNATRTFFQLFSKIVVHSVGFVLKGVYENAKNPRMHFVRAHALRMHAEHCRQ